jgi:ABC-type amino acid transport substrate-binding protein
MKTQTNYSAAFRNKELRDQFNDGLKKIRADGSYQAIIDAYR